MRHDIQGKDGLNPVRPSVSLNAFFQLFVYIFSKNFVKSILIFHFRQVP